MIRSLARSLVNPAARQLVTTDAVAEPGFILRATFDAANQGLANSQVLGVDEGVTHGSLTIGEASGTAAIASNALELVNAIGGFGEYAVAPSVTRTAGMVMLARVTVSGAGAYPAGLRFGFCTSATDFNTVGGLSAAIHDGAVVGKRVFESGEIGYTEAAEATQHDIAVVLGGFDENDSLYKGGDVSTYTYGSLFLHRPNGETLWRVLGRGIKSNAGPLYPFIASSVQTATIDYVAIPEDPIPSILTTSLAYPASDTLPLSFTGYADGFLSFKCNGPATGVIQIEFRRQDADNLWKLTIDPDFVMDLVERTGGVDTPRAQIDDRPDTTGQVVYIKHVGTEITIGLHGGSSATYTSSEHQAQTGIAASRTGTFGAIGGISDQAHEISITLEPA